MILIFQQIIYYENIFILYLFNLHYLYFPQYFFNFHHYQLILFYYLNYYLLIIFNYLLFIDNKNLYYLQKLIF